MSEPHFHEEEIVERVDPVRTRRTVSETRFGPAGNPVAVAIAFVLVVSILVLVFGFLL